MIDSLFIALLKMSLISGVLIIIVFLAQSVLKKLRVPGWIIHLLWLVVLVRLLCPLTFESFLGVENLPPLERSLTTIGEMAPTPAPVDDRGQAGETSTLAMAESTAPTTATGERDSQGISLLTTLGLVWLTGAAAILIYGIATYFLLGRQLKHSVKRRKNIYLCQTIDSPFVMGIIYPRIYLPPHLSPEEEEYILAHEKAHIRRLDHLVKPLYFLAAAIHWFNPLVWLAFGAMSRNMERACDEKAIKNLTSEQRREYGRLLLSFTEGNQRFRPGPLSFGETGAGRRIKDVLKYKKPAGIIIGAALILTVGIGALAMGGGEVGSTSTPNEPTVTPDAILGDILLGYGAAVSHNTENLNYNGQSTIGNDFIAAFGDTSTWQEYTVSDDEYAEYFTAETGRVYGAPRSDDREVLTFMAGYSVLECSLYQNGVYISYSSDVSGYDLENEPITKLYFAPTSIYSDLLDVMNKYSQGDVENLIAADEEFFQLYGNTCREDMPTLSIMGSTMTDLSDLERLTELEELYIDASTIEGVQETPNLPNLKSLVITNSVVDDFSFIEGFENLESIQIGSTEMRDISFISSLKNLTSVNLGNTYIEDISPLADLENVTSLDIYSANVSDLSPIAHYRHLTYLNLDISGVTDLSPLENITTLVELHLNNNHISDVTPLGNLTDLQHLELSATDVWDIAPIALLPDLRYLVLSGTNVTDVSPFRGREQGFSIILPTALEDDPVVAEINAAWGEDAYGNEFFSFRDSEYMESEDIGNR